MLVSSKNKNPIYHLKLMVSVIIGDGIYLSEPQYCFVQGLNKELTRSKQGKHGLNKDITTRIEHDRTIRTER